MDTSETLFAQNVWRVVCAIPEGSVVSYGEVAKRAGTPGAARAVGTLMRKNIDAQRPCHRVICADGRVGAYNRGTRVKERRLLAEGVAIRKGKVILTFRTN